MIIIIILIYKMIINYKKKPKSLSTKKQEESFFKEFAEKKMMISLNKIINIVPKNKANNSKNKLFKSQSFSKLLKDQNPNAKSNNLNHTINTVENETNIKNLINTSVEKVSKVIRKHSTKPYNSSSITKNLGNKQSSLIIIEENEEHTKGKFSKSYNLKKSSLSKPLERKKNYPNFNNKKILVKTKLTPKKENLPKVNIEVKEKDNHFDFLKGFKDKLKIFLKSKNKKQIIRPATNNSQINFINRPSLVKNYVNKSIKINANKNVAKHASIEKNTNPTCLNERVSIKNPVRKLEIKDRNKSSCASIHKLNPIITEELPIKRNPYYTTVNSPKFNLSTIQNKKNQNTGIKTKSCFSPLANQSVSPSRNKHLFSRNKTTINISRSREIINTTHNSNQYTSNPLNSLLTNDINYKIIDINKIIDFILIYKEINKTSSVENLSLTLLKLKSVLEDQEKKILNISSRSLPNLNIDDTTKNLILNNRDNENKVKLIQLKWREYKVKKLLNLQNIDKDVINNKCRDYLIQQLLSKSQNFSFVNDLFSLTLSFWEDLMKLQCFLETKNRVINLKFSSNQTLNDLAPIILTNTIRLKKVQRENVSHSEELF